MSLGLAILMLSTVASDPPSLPNWCIVGQTVMIPDGREGPVTSVSGDICKVLVYGEKYVSLWPYYLIEPTQLRFGH